jgi:hypothetical protein
MGVICGQCGCCRLLLPLARLTLTRQLLAACVVYLPLGPALNAYILLTEN